jgi:hypothetical protein
MYIIPELSNARFDYWRISYLNEEMQAQNPYSFENLTV